VRNAAKLAVYEDIMISVKNHHMPATILVETALCSTNEQESGKSGLSKNCNASLIIKDVLDKVCKTTKNRALGISGFNQI
jgi:hypothetical protein